MLTRRSPMPGATVVESSPVVPFRLPVDAVYATAVLSPTQMLACFFWGRSIGYREPLLLLDFSCTLLEAQSWAMIQRTLTELNMLRRARTGHALGMWIEGEALAHQAMHAGIDARQIPPHLTRDEAWHPICQSVAALMAGGSVDYTPRAQEAMEARPFPNTSGPRTDDPLVPAFLYGVVLGLDEVLARDPHPKMPVRSSRA